MKSIKRGTTAPPEQDTNGVRCPICQRFARLQPGDTACTSCAGMLALEFPRKGGGR